MKRIKCVFLFLISFVVSGQKISFNQEILSTKDSEIVAVRELWKAYVGDCLASFLTKKDSILLKYWNATELEQGFTDIAKELGIEKGQIDSFLKKYIQNHKEN